MEKLNKETQEKRQELIDEGADEEAIDAYIALGIGDDDLSDFAETYQGKWSNDEDFVYQLLEDTGELPKDLPPYIHIDMEATARDVMMDYSEENGHYFRNL